MSEINQKEYLKKYLSIGVDPGTKKKKKKKKVKSIGDRVKIIDDDIDVSKTFDIPEDELFASNEDAPQIVGVIDDRPPELRIEDYRKTGLWKPVGGNDDVQIKVEPGEKSPSQYQNKNSGWVTSQASDRSEGTGFNFGAFRIKKEPVDDYDLSAQNDTHRRTVKKEPASPNHKRRKDVSPSRRKTSESNSTGSKDRDFSPPRKKQREDDASPPRRRRQDDDISPPRRRNNDDDVSPPRRRLKHDDISPPRRRRQDDVNPPRRRKDDDASPPRRRQTSNNSPPRRKQRGDDINSSQRRRQDDISPPRRRKDDDVSPPRRKRTDDDISPPRNRKQGDMSPPRKQQKNDNNRRHRNDSSSPQRRNKDKANLSPPRQRRSDSSKKRNDSDESSTSKQHSLEEGTSKHTKEASKKMTTTLDGKAAGLQSADKLVKETAEFKKRENELFAKLSVEMSGANAAPIVRDRKTSKKRNLEEEAKEQLEKQKEEEKLKEKYSRWGKGLKQVEDMNQKIADEIHEMSKPLARYADDEDLERFLKEQEREGDPMLNYIRKKKKKKAVEEGKPLKPMYMGEFMPNRFGIPPGHRWDGVDRSNGYEKKWFEIQNAKKAQQEEVYKWSTEDM